MDWKTFISEIVKALAWPTAVVVLFLTFRGSVSAILLKMNRLRFKEFEAEFGRIIEQEQRKADEAELPPAIPQPELPHTRFTDSDYLIRMAEIAPRSAVIEGWVRVEMALHAAAERLGLPAHQRLPLKQLDELAAYVGPKRASALHSIINELRRLRNEVAHHGEVNLSVIQATEYVRLALRAVKTLDALQPAGR